MCESDSVFRAVEGRVGAPFWRQLYERWEQPRAFFRAQRRAPAAAVPARS